MSVPSSSNSKGDTYVLKGAARFGGGDFVPHTSAFFVHFCDVLLYFALQVFCCFVIAIIGFIFNIIYINL